MAETFLVESPDVTYSKDFIEAKYTYSTVHVCKENGVTKVRDGDGELGDTGTRPGGTGSRGPARWVLAHLPGVCATQVRPCSTRFTFRTGRQVPRLGLMLVGWGGNNGTTVTAAVLANRLGLSWMTKTGRKVGVRAAPRHGDGGARGGPVPTWVLRKGGCGPGFLVFGGRLLILVLSSAESQLLRLAAPSLHRVPGHRPHR